MFGFGKTTLTHEHLANILCRTLDESTKAMVRNELEKSSTPFNEDDEFNFLNEWTIFMYWVILRLPFDCDKERLMEGIHMEYFNAYGYKTPKLEGIGRKIIKTRYEEYESVFDSSKEGQLLLCGTVAKNILERDEIVLDIIVQMTLANYFHIFSKTLLDMSNKFKGRG